MLIAGVRYSTLCFRAVRICGKISSEFASKWLVFVLHTLDSLKHAWTPFFLIRAKCCFLSKAAVHE